MGEVPLYSPPDQSQVAVGATTREIGRVRVVHLERSFCHAIRGRASRVGLSPPDHSPPDQPRGRVSPKKTVVRHHSLFSDAEWCGLGERLSGGPPFSLSPAERGRTREREGARERKVGRGWDTGGKHRLHVNTCAT